MDLPIHIDETLNHAVRLPHSFLNHLLEDGYQFDQGMLCLKLTTLSGDYCYCCMNDFKSKGDSDSVDVGLETNTFLNMCTGMYVHVDRVQAQRPYLVKMQAHKESFGDIPNLKEQLETMLVQIRALNKGVVLYATGLKGLEPFTIIDILNNKGETMDWGLTVESEVRIDFERTKEAIETKEREEKERLARLEQEELESRGFIGPGHTLGSVSCDDPRKARQDWLDRLQSLSKSMPPKPDNHKVKVKVKVKETRI